MTALQKSLASAAAMMLLIAPPALGQAGPTDFTGGQPPCGDYYGSEYGTYCRPGMDGRVGRHTCAYRTGPPCPAARVRAPPRR